MSTNYPVSERNKLRRLHERGRYDHEAVHAVLDAAMLCHMAYVIDGQPYCTPTAFWREGEHLYWHGSSASRMLRAQGPGLPVCLTVTHLDGLILARSGFNHSVNYRSAMCFGTAHIIDDLAEKTRALDAMIDRFYPGRNATLRPGTAQELKATTVVGMKIDQASAKVRAKGVADDEGDLGLPIYAALTCPRRSGPPVM
jgi:nitroimidazol reductase NimA-like FMN-containing flavoprotein (pyridoxamine 5'-phosphate oxidase superfamily)